MTMFDIGRGILEEFSDRACQVQDMIWIREGLSLHAAHVGTAPETKRLWSKKNRVKMNAHRRAMRKLNPNYGR